MSGSVDLGSAHGQVILNADGVARGVNQAGASLRQLEGFAASAGASFARFAADIAGFALKAGAAVATGLGVAVAAGVKGAADLEQAVANISSIKPEIDTSEVTKSLNDLSTRVPQSAQQLADSLYNIFSSVEVTQAQALTLVEQFAQGAIGAQTDAETFGTAILGVMNGFGIAVEDAGHVADVFFNTVNRGVVTGPELAASLGPVTQSAKAAGLSLDDLGGFIAGVTKEGGPAAQNINNLNNFLQKITTKDAQKEINGLGVATVKADGSFRNIVDILGDLKPKLEGMTEAQRNNAIQAIFPDAQARIGAQVLLSQLDFVKSSIDENRNSAGAAERAFATMIGTFKSQSALLRNTVSADLRTVGAALLPLGTTIVATFTDALQQAGPQIAALSVRLGVLAEAGFQQLTRAVPPAIAALRLLIVTITGLFRAFRSGDFNSVFGPIIAGISAAFGTDAAAAVALFVSRALRGLQLVRDAALTIRDAAAGNWFGGQSAGIDSFVRDIGRFTQLARDAFITVRQVFDRQWVSAPEVQPLIRAIGTTAVAVRDLGDKLRGAGAGFAAIFTPERIAILRQFAVDLLGVRTDVLVNGLRLLGDALVVVIGGMSRLAALVIDGLGALQGTGREVDVLRGALLLLGGVLALNKFADFVAGARSAQSALSAFFTTITRGPRLVVTTIRTIYQTIGQAINALAVAGRTVVQTIRTVYESVGSAVNFVGGTITRTVRAVFASAQDAAIWAQLYGEQAVQTITRRIKTVYDALPPAPNIPDLVVRAIPQFDTSGIGATSLPTLNVGITPTINPNISLGSIGTDLGFKLAGGIAAGLGAAIGGAIVASGALAAMGTAIAAAAPYIIAGLLIVAALAATAFVVKLAADFVANAGGIGPALAQIFLDAIPFALGAVSGVLLTLGLSLVNLIIQGLLQGFPALVAAVQANFQQIVFTIAAIFAPLPTLIYVVLSQIGPTLAAFAGQVVAAVGGAFSQVGTIVSETLGQLGALATAAFQSVVNAVVGIGGQIVTAVVAAFAPISQVISAIIAGDWGGAVLAGLALIINLFGVLPGQIAAILGEGLSQIATIIASTLGTAATAVATAFTGIVSAVTEAGSAIVSAVTDAFNNVLITITSILAGIGASILQFLGSYVDGFNATFNSELPGIVASGMAQLVSSIASGIGQAVSLVASLPGRIAGAIGNLGAILFNAGAQAMAGLLSGIESMVGAVLGRAASIAGQVAGAFADALKIRSPSRVFMELGRNTIAGLVVGMADATPEATKQAAEVASSVYNAVKSGVEAINSLGSLRAINPAVIATFAETTRAIVGQLVAVASSFATDALEAAGKFTDTAGKMFGVVKTGVEAFAALRSVIRPTADQVGIFAAGMRDLVGALVEAARGFDADGLAGAQAVADTATKIFALIKPAVEALRLLPGIVQPTASQLGVFTQGIIDLCLSLVRAASIIDSDGLGAAGTLAETAMTILALIAPAAAGMRLLGGIIQPTADQLGVFTQGIIDITLSLVNASRLFTAEGLAGAAALGKTAGEIIGLIKPAVDGFRLLPQIVQPTGSQLGVFTQGVVDITLSLVNASRLFDRIGLEAASQLSKAAGDIIGLIGPAVAGFRALATIVAPSTSAIRILADGVGAITRAIVNVAATFTAEALSGATIFSDAASKVLGLVGTGIQALAALSGAGVISIDTGRLDAFAASVRTLVAAIGQVARSLSSEIVTAAGNFSQDAAKAVGLLGSGVDGFAKLADFQPISPAQIDAFVAAVLLTVQRVAAAAKRIDAETVKAAGDFADSAGKVVGLIGSAISAFTIKTNVDAEGNAKQADRLITTAEIDQIVFLAQYAVGRLVGVAKGFDPGQLAGLATFSDAASKGFGALKGVLDAIQAPTKGSAPKEGTLTPLQAIDTLIGLFNEGVGRLGTLVGVAQQYLNAANQVRSIMLQAGAAFGEALSGLALPQGATPQALALAAGGTFTVQQVITHRAEGAIDIRFLGENGGWVVSSLQADKTARDGVIGIVAEGIAPIFAGMRG